MNNNHGFFLKNTIIIIILSTINKNDKHQYIYDIIPKHFKASINKKIFIIIRYFEKWFGIDLSKKSFVDGLGTKKVERWEPGWACWFPSLILSEALIRIITKASTIIPVASKIPKILNLQSALNLGMPLHISEHIFASDSHVLAHIRAHIRARITACIIFGLP